MFKFIVNIPIDYCIKLHHTKLTKIRILFNSSNNMQENSSKIFKKPKKPHSFKEFIFVFLILIIIFCLVMFYRYPQKISKLAELF